MGLETEEPAVTPPPAELEPDFVKKSVSPGTPRKREIPQGLFTKCPKCSEMIFDKTIRGAVAGLVCAAGGEVEFAGFTAGG